MKKTIPFLIYSLRNIHVLSLLIILVFFCGCGDFRMENDSNANIKFDVTVRNGGQEFRIGMQGIGTTIDWGDGKIEEIAGKTGQEMEVYSHVYSQKGVYRVTMSTLHTTAISTYKDYPITRFEINECSSLISLQLNNISDMEKFFPLGCKNLRYISIDNCPSLNSVGFELSTRINGFSCSNTNLTDLYIASNQYLKILSIDNAPLATLNLASNKSLQTIAVKNTKVKTLNLSNNKSLTSVYSISNAMDAEDLNSMFSSLPSAVGDSQCTISYWGNPGANSCQTSILKAKGWQIR